MQVNFHQIAAKGYLTEAETLKLRQEIFADGRVSDEELDLAFDLAAIAPNGGVEWHMLFSEICEDYFLKQAMPQFYFSEEMEAEVLQRFRTPAGDSNTLYVMALIHIIKKSQKAPVSICKLSKKHIRVWVNHTGMITAEHCEIIRDWLYAAGSSDGLGVSRREANFLMDVNDDMRGRNNDPAWADLFMKAIANHLMSERGYEAPDRAEALRRERWLEDDSTNVTGFLGGLLSGMSILAVAQRDREDLWHVSQSNVTFEEKLTYMESDWLKGRVGKDGYLNEAEKALVTYVEELSGIDLEIKSLNLAEVA